jgi:hypothetical protein
MGYSTHLNVQTYLSEHTSRNECLLRYGQVCIWLHSTKITLQCSWRQGQCESCTFLYLPWHMLWLSQWIQYMSCSCTTKEIATTVAVLNLYEISSVVLLGKWQTWPCQWKFFGSISPLRGTWSTTQNPISRDVTSDWANLDPLLLLLMQTAVLR